MSNNKRTCSPSLSWESAFRPWRQLKFSSSIRDPPRYKHASLGNRSAKTPFMGGCFSQEGPILMLLTLPSNPSCQDLLTSLIDFKLSLPPATNSSTSEGRPLSQSGLLADCSTMQNRNGVRKLSGWIFFGEACNLQRPWSAANICELIGWWMEFGLLGSSRNHESSKEWSMTNAVQLV